MSDVGLYGSIYEILRSYADRLDRALLGLRSQDHRSIEIARNDLVRVLREIIHAEPPNAAARLVAVVVRQDLPRIYGEEPGVCESLASVLEERAPDQSELTKLEHIAAAIDRECSHTMARLRGRT
jgi:hypothetical protein